MSIPELYTERLTLRPYRTHDAARLVELLADRDVSRTTLNIPYPYTPDDAVKYISFATSVDTEDGYMWAITHNAEIIGGISLRIERRHNRAETGYWVGKSYWGKGFVTEAVKAILKFGFDKLNLNKIYAQAFPNNPASSRVMEKVGMQYEGCLREHVRRDSIYHDLRIYSILKEDYDV